MQPKVAEEITRFTPEWAKLRAQHHGSVCTHTLNVLYLIFSSPDVLQMSKEDQNILRWAALLHDICKLSTPKIEGKDHIHPFKSGKSTLLSFRKSGILDLSTDEKRLAFKTVTDAISQSRQPVSPDYVECFRKKGQPYCHSVHSHHLLSDIFLNLWETLAPRGSFVDLVFRLVFFHQSLQGAEEFPPMVALSKEERLIYCDERFFKLILQLMICDSNSYQFVYNPDGKMSLRV